MERTGSMALIHSAIQRAAVNTLLDRELLLTSACVCARACVHSIDFGASPNTSQCTFWLIGRGHTGSLHRNPILL